MIVVPITTASGGTMYQYGTLPNGLRIICEPMPYLHSLSIGLWVLAGSRNERPGQEGISHLIEHMFFKGTARRSARRIAEEIDAVGGQLNAFTTREYTCFYAKTLDAHLELALDLLSDMYCASALDPRELAKEKNVVLEEIRSYEDAPDELAHDLLAKALWPDHPLGRPILGMPASIEAFTKEDILAYLAENYRADNTVLAAAGNVSFDEVYELAGRLLSDLPASGGKEQIPAPVPQALQLARLKDIEQVHFCLGGQGVGRCSADKYAVHVLDSILGGSVSSRLFQSLREDRGLVYATGTSHSAFRDVGLFAVYAGTSPERVREVIALIIALIREMLMEPISESDLRRAKEQLRGNFLLGLESTSTRMSRLAKALLFDDAILTPEEVGARLDAVTGEDVLRVARSIFAGHPLSAAAVGPDLADLDLEGLLRESVCL